MAVVGRGTGHILAAILLLLIQEATNAPVTEDGPSQALQLADTTGYDGRGCYYNFEHYEEGERILTNEPCLNCTCHNRMLMCYLRVCPFSKAIGQDCIVEKKNDQCCPVITCPQVPVALLTSTTSETPLTTTALGRPDNYGCILEDNTFYADGAQVPSDPKKPCELCYCIRNHTACIMQECTLNVEGCKPVYQEGVCCPVRYDCDYDEVSTTPKPAGLVTTPGATTDCLHNGETYHDGAMVTKDEKAPCEHCYCMRGDIVCAVQECGTPLEGRDCTPLERTPGQCCPNYQCANATQPTESLLTSTEKLPESVKDESGEINQDSSESSNESEKSSEEVSSHEVSETEPPKVNENNESHSQEVPQPTDATNVHTESPPIEISHSSTEPPRPVETASAESTKTEEDIPAKDHHEDSHSAASHEEPHEIVKDPQVTNEIPAATLQEQSVAPTTTEEPPVEAARIPGEGSCLVEGKTYAHNTIVPTENPCQEVCRCFSSIVSCKPRDCPPAPSPSENCLPVMTPGSCCPTYTCDQKTSDAPEVQDHKIEHTHHDDSSNLQEVLPTTLPPSFEENSATDAPAVVGIPPSLIPGANEHGLTIGTEDEETNMPHIETQKEDDEVSQPQEIPQPADHSSHVNSNIVHGHDASLHGEHSSDHLDSQANGNVAHPVSELTTVAPTHTDSSAEANQENVHTESHTEQYVSPTEQPGFSQDQDITQDQTVSSLINRDEEKVEEVHKHDEAESQSSVTEHSEVEPTTPLNIVHDSEAEGEPTHEENTSESEVFVPNTSSEETSEEVQTTAAPEESSYHLDGQSHSDDTSGEQSHSDDTAGEQFHSDDTTGEQSHSDDTSDEQSHSDDTSDEQSHSDDTSQEQIHSDDANTEHETSSQSIHPDISPESTTLPSASQDPVSSSHEENSKPSEEIENEHYTPNEVAEQAQTEKIDDGNVASETPTSGEEQFATTTIPEESFQNLFEHTPDSAKDEVVKQEETVTESAPAEHQEAQAPTTAYPVSEETVTISSETIHHDSLPDSSHHSEETAENTESIEPIKSEDDREEENVKESEQGQITSVSQEKSPDDTTAPSVSLHETSESHLGENETEKPIHETEATSMPDVEQQPAIQVHDNTEEQQQQEIPTPNPVNNQHESTQPAKEHEVPSISSQATHDEIATIIYEEVKVTGMPPIESHVTEGNLDHSISHQEISHQDEATTQASEEKHEISSEGPEGLGEKIKNEEPIKENVGTVSSVENSSSQESTDHKEDSKPSETTEGTAQSTTSPVIVNEINEEKESLNQITSDNTAQLIDDINQIIQNEVNNQLHLGGHPEHEPTDEESEPSGGTETASNETGGDKGDFTTPQAIEEHHSVEVQQPIEEVANTDIKEETTGSLDLVQPETTSLEKEPNQDVSGEDHSESAVTVTNEGSATSSPAHEVTSLSSEQDEIEEQKEDEKPHPQKETDESGQKEPSVEPSLSQTQEENESSEKPETPNETIESVENTSAPEIHTEAPETVDKNEDELNKISSIQTDETSDIKPPEEQPTTVTPAESPQEHMPQESQNGEQNQPEVTEEQNAIPAEAPQVINSNSQTPDSANQVLEESGEDGNAEGTEQSVHSSSHDNSSAHVPSETSGEGEVGKDSIKDASHQDENVVPSEQNVAGEGTNEQDIEHVQPETQQGEHIPEENITAEPASVHPESQSEDTASESSEHQEGPTPSQEATTKPSASLVTEVSQDEIHVSGQENTSEKEVIPETHQEEINKSETEKPAIVSDSEESGAEHHETIPAEHEIVSGEDHEAVTEEHHEPVPDEHHESVPEEHHETVPENHETVPEENHETIPAEHHETTPVEHHETATAEHHETAPAEHHETTPAEHHETAPVEHHEIAPAENQETIPVKHHETTPAENQETIPVEHQETIPEEHHETIPGHQETIPAEHQETISEEHHETIPEEHQETISEEHHETITGKPQETISEEHHETISGETIPAESQETIPEEHHETTTAEHHETTPAEHHEQSPAESQESDPVENQQMIPVEHQEQPLEDHEPDRHHQEETHGPQEHTPEHQGSGSESQFTSPHLTEDQDYKEVSTAAPYVDTSSETVHSEGDTESHKETPKPSLDAEQDSHKNEDSISSAQESNVPSEITPANDVHQPAYGSDSTQNILHSTEAAFVSEIPSSTTKPVEEPNPMFPSWSQKPFEQQTTPESHHAEENPYPSGFEPEYDDEEGVSYGPGTCRYGGKIYLSAQQIPRDDPCDFCFCFRSDIICLQQSCPPPIRGCYQETIKGFCCPRYECHVSMATMLNITTTTTTTTTTLPPHFFAHAYNGAATKAGCQVKGVAYHVGERIPSTSGPCLDCRCGANGQMKCDPTVCGPQEALLRQVMDAAVSRRRR